MFRDFKYTIYRTVISDIYVKEWLANMDKINDFVSRCQTLKNSSASFLCIQETYIISTISQFESD